MLALYSSDLHGNLVQYGKLIRFAIRTGADALIIGGDIAPKHCNDIIGSQRHFF